jgi:hypothetical protein
MDWLLQDADLLSLTDTDWVWGLQTPWRGLFIEQFILPHRNKNALIRWLPNIYVLIGWESGDQHVPAGGKKWKDLLSDTQHNFLKKYEFIPLGFIMFQEKRNYLAVNWLETFLRGHNLGLQILHKLSEKYNYEFRCIPSDISSAPEYWRFYFKSSGLGIPLLEKYRIRGVELLLRDETTTEEQTATEEDEPFVIARSNPYVCT